MFELPKVKTRICVSTWVKEEDLPEGQRLLTCSKCKAVCYVNRQEQIAHWPIHKKVYRKLQDDEAAYRVFHQGGGLDDIRECFGITNDLLGLGGLQEGTPDLDTVMLKLSVQGRFLLFSLQQLKWFLSQKSQQNVVQDESFKDAFETFCTIPLSALISAHGERFVQLLFAVPGFSNWFFSDDILLSEEMKRRKDLGVNAKDGEVCPEHLLHESFYKFVVHIMGAVLDTFSFEDPGGSGLLLNSCPLAAAIVRWQMKNALCPYYRASFPFDLRALALVATLEIALSSMHEHGNSALRSATASNEIISGMGAKDFFSLVLQDDLIFETYDNVAGLLECLMLIESMYGGEQSGPPFSCLTSEDREELLSLFLLWKARVLHTLPAAQDNATELPQVLVRFIFTSHACSRVMVALYYHVKAKAPEAQNPMVTQYLDTLHDRVLEIYLPSTRAFVEILERQYVDNVQSGSAAPAAGQTAPSSETLPEDCVKLITEFSLMG